MKAAVIEKQGALENLVYRDWPDPVAGEGEVLVRVRAFERRHTKWATRGLDQYGTG